MLIDGERDGRSEGVDDVEGVFEAGLHVVFGGFGGHPLNVGDCIRR